MSNLASEQLKVKLSPKSGHEYEILVGSNVLSKLGALARKSLNEKARRISLVSNPKVFRLYGEKAMKSLKESGYDVSPWLMKDGERYKNWRSLQEALNFFSSLKLTRSDAVVALGGGVVGDLAGFAASIYLRGIEFLQVPTTLLSQIDSSVGGKTGINTDYGKNLIGAFHQPNGVLIDIETLQTLPQRELVAGFCEAVKHSAISSRELFMQTQNFLQNFPVSNHKKLFSSQNEKQFRHDLQKIIIANVAFKAEIVAGDEHENAIRADARSRKILNFGHTIGHALEKVTDYKRFKHGEAVGLGMMVVGEMSKRLGKLTQNELKLLNDVLRRVGRLPDASDISPEKLIAAFAHDKKAVGDSIQWVLLEQIGRASIEDGKNIPEKVLRESLRAALQS